MSHFATFSQNGNKSHHQLLFKKGDLELYLPSNYARRSIDTLFPNGFTQHWTLLGISFPPYFSTTLLLLSFSRRRNFMPNYLGNSRTANVIFFPWQSFPEKNLWSHCKKSNETFWVIFKQCAQCLKPTIKVSFLRAKRATFISKKPLVNRFCPLKILSDSFRFWIFTV